MGRDRRRDHRNGDLVCDGVLSLCPVDAESGSEAADRALYTAKGDGRDRLVMAEPVRQLSFRSAAR
jgi:hypothetical protein